MNKNYLVTKSNYFIMNSSYDLSLEEQKIILTLASMVEPDDDEFKTYKFRISEFMDLVGVSDKSKYTEIPKITKNLMKKVFEIQEGDTLIQTAWLSGAKYKKGSGEVELTFSSYLKPYMLKLGSFFTQYKLANILSMKSKYSPRIYEILKCNEFKKQGYIEIDIEELRRLLKVENIYVLYANLKQKLLLPTQKELKKFSDITFEFEEIKIGRKIATLRFYIYSNNKNNNENISNIYDATNVVLEDKEDFIIYSEDDIKLITSMMKEHNINDLEARKIYTSACGDINKISKIYNYFKNKNADNFVALMIKMVKPGEFIEPRKNTCRSKFDNFKGRKYDYDELEKKLLGWD